MADGEAALLRQQEILAQFGELALRSEDLDEILTEACRLVRDALGTDLAKVMELQQDGTTLLVRAGIGWKPGVVGEVTVKVERGSSEGYALETGKPVASDDIDRETRFKYADFLKDNGVKALVNVSIGAGGSKSPFGILQVDSLTPRQFGDRETTFLRGYANLIAAAVDRFRADAELRQTQVALQEREATLRQSQKLEAVGQLTGGVAHDFNNLLTIIKSSTDLLRRPDLAEERRQRYVGAISDTVDRAAKLTGQLLAFARRQALQPEVFDVMKNVAAISEMVGTLTGSRIHISTRAPDEPCLISADPSQFDTAIVNMALNARDAMGGEGGLAITVRAVDAVPAIRSHPLEAGDFVAVSLSDTGTGIAPEQLERVFEPFFTTKGVGEGTGLGLSQVFGFAKQSGGDVEVESAVGRGTTFTLYLPRARDEETAAASRDRGPSLGDSGGGRRVLVVEDNVQVGTFSTQLLQDLGYETTWAVDASDALSVLAGDGRPFDIVFSDVVMPGMSGVDLGHEIQRRFPGLPIVLTSGYSHILVEEGRHGFELLKKPYAVEELSGVISRVTRR